MLQFLVVSAAVKSSRPENLHCIVLGMLHEQLNRLVTLNQAELRGPLKVKHKI